jgi:MFS family permease
MKKRTYRVFYGWWVVIALAVIEMFGSMGRYSMTAFFPFVSSEFGWPRSLIGSAQTINLWVYGLIVPFSGWTVDHIGGRKTFLAGGGVFVVSWILLSAINAPWKLYIFYSLIMGITVSMIHMVPIQATANKWFKRRAGLVTGIASAAFGVGVAIFMPLITHLANSLGWRVTSFIYGISAGIAIMILAFYVIRDTPESLGLHPDDEVSNNMKQNDGCTDIAISAKEAMKTKAFWILFIAYSLVGIPMQGILAHLVIWGVDTGTSKALAGIYITAMFLPSVASKIGGGWLGDRFGKKRIIIISQLCCVLLLVWAWRSVNTSNTLTAFSVLIGLGYGIPMGLFAPYLVELFGRANVGTLFGILTLGHGLIGGLGPLLWGYIFDCYGSYNIACLVSAACYLVIAVAVSLIGSSTQKVLKNESTLL